MSLLASSHYDLLAPKALSKRGLHHRSIKGTHSLALEVPLFYSIQDPFCFML